MKTKTGPKKTIKSIKKAGKTTRKSGKAKPPVSERKVDYSRMVVIPRNGEPTLVPLNDISIPDLWHVAQAAQEAIDALAAIQAVFDDESLDAKATADAIHGIVNDETECPETPDGKKAAEGIKSVWHTAHELKKNLAGDVPAVV